MAWFTGARQVFTPSGPGTAANTGWSRPNTKRGPIWLHSVVWCGCPPFGRLWHVNKCERGVEQYAPQLHLTPVTLIPAVF
jgi:hypothetical protein